MRHNQDAAVAAATVADDARSALLADLLGQVAGCFPRRETRQCCGQMLRGLLMELDDHNCWTIAEAIGHRGPHRLQHLLSRAVWDDQQVLDTASAWAAGHLDDGDAVLIVDETADAKSSADCAGAARQYSGTAGGVALCQAAVTVTYASGRGHALIGRALYLPEACAAGQAKNWIYPKIGATKLKDLTATDAEKFFEELGQVLSKRTLVMIKSTLRRSIRRAQVHNLIARNVVELIDLPSGQPGRPSRAMTQAQASKVLKAAGGRRSGFVKVVRAAKGRDGAAHAATETGELACGNKPHPNATITGVSAELEDTTCRTCRSQLGLDDSDEANGRLEALFVISITLGLRPGELRKLSWDHVDLNRGVVHVWRSASKSGDTKTPKSKRSLELPKRAIAALTVHKARQANERQAAGGAWHDNDLVFCHENGDPYTSDQLNWRFSKMTRKAGIGRWHAHEGRHTAVSIMSSNGVPIQEISDTVGHKSTHVTETVYRHVIVPEIRGGATVMDDVFDD